MTENESNFETVKMILTELLENSKKDKKYKITVNAAEINAFQDGWREGFIAGVNEGIAAMSYVQEQMTSILQSALSSAANALENTAENKTQTSKPSEKDQGFYQ